MSLRKTSLGRLAKVFLELSAPLPLGGGNVGAMAVYGSCGVVDRDGYAGWHVKKQGRIYSLRVHSEKKTNVDESYRVGSRLDFICRW